MRYLEVLSGDEKGGVREIDEGFEGIEGSGGGVGGYEIRVRTRVEVELKIPVSKMSP